MGLAGCRTAASTSPGWRSGVVGIGFVLYLVSAELLIIKAICIWCTGVHIVTFAQLLLVVATVPAMLGWGPSSRRNRPAGDLPGRPAQYGGADDQPARRSSSCLRSTSFSPPQMPWGSRILIA